MAAAYVLAIGKKAAASWESAVFHHHIGWSEGASFAIILTLASYLLFHSKLITYNIIYVI
jgi:hypothetical protein